MNPTLREPEIMEILPYNGMPVRVGDVAFFLPPLADQPVVHRVIRVTPAGISTLGDNNPQEDPYLVPLDRIKGQVVAAWRGQKRRVIAGGSRGRLTRRWLLWRRSLDRGISPLLHPAYQALSLWGGLARIVPPRFRPRVVVFRSKEQDQFQLLLGRHVIGRYDECKNQWLIRRPFHLFVDGRLLPRKQDRARVNRDLVTERRRSMNSLLAQGVRYALSLKDGSCWDIVAGDEAAASLVSQLAGAMRLPVAQSAIESSPCGSRCRLFVDGDAQSALMECYVPLASENGGMVVSTLSACTDSGGSNANLLRLSLIFAREAQSRGGILIHGALAERDGMGVILSAPGGTGKTTASNRFPAPWRSLCDDTTLVVRDPQGAYWAHPWPTWSRFMEGGPGGSWDVQKAVPLKGIFILARAADEHVERVGPGHAVSMLVECARQASQFMPFGLFKEEIRALHLEQFKNLCALARVMPVHVLQLSLTGAFWEKIEETLSETPV